MATADLALGVNITIWVAGILTFLYGAFYFLNSVLSFDLDDLLLFAGIVAATAASVVCVVFPIINTTYNLAQNPSYQSIAGTMRLARSEFATGVFPLRVISVIVGLQAIATLFKLGTISTFETKPDGRKKLFEFPETALVPELPAIPAYRNRAAHYLLVVAQCGFYEAAVLLLWRTNMISTRVHAAALLSWLLFYIVDDWRIMSHYSSAFKGRLTTRHVRQIWLTNAAIFVLSAYCAYELGAATLVVYVAASYVMLRLILLLMNGVVGNMIIVDALNWRKFNEEYEQATGEDKRRTAG